MSISLYFLKTIRAETSAKQKGLPLTVETGQHYLYFNAENIKDGQTQFKCAPPIREKENNDQLWNALEEGVIDFIATDHSPAPANLKEIESGNFEKSMGRNCRTSIFTTGSLEKSK